MCDPHPADVAAAFIAASRAVDACERDLRRVLSDGERRDLLCDNTRWSRPFINSIVAMMNR
jgi:hypothetical protein